jgi:hypothetical protein
LFPELLPEEPPELPPELPEPAASLLEPELLPELLPEPPPELPPEATALSGPSPGGSGCGLRLQALAMTKSGRGTSNHTARALIRPPIPKPARRPVRPE